MLTPGGYRARVEKLERAKRSEYKEFCADIMKQMGEALENGEAYGCAYYENKHSHLLDNAKLHKHIDPLIAEYGWKCRLCTRLDSAGAHSVEWSLSAISAPRVPAPDLHSDTEE